MTATPDQVIAQIREALEAGPTPGEWVIDEPNSHLVARLVDGAYEYICAVEPSTFSKTSRPPREDDKNARFIAACNPQNIAVLLGEINNLQSVVHAMNEDFAGLKAERDALRKALEDMQPHIDKLSRCIRVNDELGRVVAGQTEAVVAIADIHARTLSGDKS